MSRLGFLIHDNVEIEVVADEIFRCYSLKNLKTEGIFTHFASADFDGDKDGSFTENQFFLFTQLIKALENMGIKIPISHCCNSAATITSKKMHLNMIRPGIILY